MSSSLSPAERSLRARLAAHSRWSKHDPAPHAERMRAGLLARFERDVLHDLAVSIVGPLENLTDVEIGEAFERGRASISPKELARRVEQRRKAYYSELAYRSVRARSRKPA